MKQENRKVLQTRRSFLKALGVTAAALPFYSMLENNVVLGQTGMLPLKFIGFGYFHGTAAQHWCRQAGETDTDYSFAHPDSPFTPFDDAATYGASFKDRLTILEGFDFGVGEYDLNGQSMHVPMHGAMGLLLTGSCKQNDQLQNASIDQYLAAKYGGSTRFRSLQFRSYDQLGFPLDSGWCMSFDSGGTALAPLSVSTEIWDTVFVGSIVGTDAASQAKAARQRAIGASVLDFVTKDIQRMNQRLASPERDKLDQHLTVIRDLEQRLSAVSNVSSCSPPPRRDPATSGYKLDKFTPGNVLPICDFNIELLAEIIVCGLTRFATFLLPNEFGPSTDGKKLQLIYDGSTVGAVDGTQNWPMPVYDDLHNQCAHRLQDSTTPAALMSQRMISATNRIFYGKIAKVMKRLNEANLLDSTLIFAGSDGGHGAAHSTQHIPMLLAGGTNGQVKLGRRIVSPGRTAQVGAPATGAMLTSHNPVLVAIANLFGEQLTSYGTCGRTEFTKGVSSLLG